MQGPEYHPELRLAARALPRHMIGPRSLAPLRHLAALLDARPSPRSVTISGLTPKVSVRVHRAQAPSGSRSALLWIHGGGYVIGSARGEDRVCREFADALGITVAAVDYRLAPEHPFPAPLEDCYTGLLWLAQQSFVNPARIAIGGPSAGGGLAAALALLARDRGQVTPVLQLLSYPMLDDRTVSPTGPQRRNRLWDHRSNRFGWTSYLGGADPRAAVPARRQDLTGLAPAWIGVGTLDLFHDEALAYAARLTRAEVPCHTTVVAGAFHGFDRVVPRATVSKAFRLNQIEALGAALR